MNCAFIDLGKHYGGAENYLLTIFRAWLKENNGGFIVVKRNSTFHKKATKAFGEDYVIAVEYSIKDVFYLKKKIKEMKIQFLNINGINSGFFINLCKIRLPIITTVHSNAFMDRINANIFVRQIFVLLENHYLNKSKRIICVSESIRELLISRNIEKNKICVVHNGVKEINYPNKAYRRDKKNCMKICFVGRLEEVKGCGYLIKAINLIKTLNIKCDIYGDGNLMSELHNEVLSLGIEDIIEFKGFSNNIREELFNYDVIVIPSMFEAFPLTIPEAMNAKTIVVCSNVGGMPYIITDGINGYTFDVGDFNQLSECIKKIYNDPLGQSNIIMKAYEDFNEKYKEEIMVENTFKVFKLLHRGNS